MMAAELTLGLQVLNILILPALVFVVRIDRNLAQLQTVQEHYGRQLEKLEHYVDTLNQRLMKLESQ
jgi:hypothetical protein